MSWRRHVAVSDSNTSPSRLEISVEFAVDVNCSGDARARDHFVPAFVPTLHERCNNEKRYRLCTGASV